ncbi:MAG: hypothetical protein SGJ00_12690 [bacterium]|nr:hypothetical protein [bacterium]
MSTTFWEYDGRLGRRWNVDSKPVPSVSVYAVLNNNPIWFTGILGDSSVWDNKGYMIHYDGKDKDLRAYIQNGDKLTLLGSLGGEIYATKWFPNHLR